MHIDTRIARFSPAPGDPHGSTSTPIYQTATFAQESALGFGEFDYSRSGNPTRQALEDKLADLEGGPFGFAFASGMAAISNLMRSAFADGTHYPGRGSLIVGADLYGGTTRLIERLVAPLGVGVRSVDTTDLDAVREALAATRTDPTWILLESPSNPLLRISDISAVADLAHEHGARLAVDNTALSPYLQNPLALGADVVVHSATKHLGGHGDLTAGVLVTRDPDLAETIGFLKNAEGTALGPFDSWLLMRGIKTLGVRLAQESCNAQRVAQFLQAHPAVRTVHYPGLASHPGHDLLARQARGPGQLLSFETRSPKLSQQICEATELFTIAVSFGSTGSTIGMPCRMSHASVPDQAIQAGRVAELPGDLVRLSIGLENPDDLIEDLGQAMRRRPLGSVGQPNRAHPICSESQGTFVGPIR
ncbi:MAG: PLP-dependent transferase [Planctomycetota bacterium]|nr:PLP-dependent transferase [Planctomycetota bacterium]